MKYLLGVDLGTTAIKTALFNTEGQKVASCTKEYSLLAPQPQYAEQEPEVYWSAFRESLSAVLNEAKTDSEDILALSVSAQGETMTCLDKDGNPLRNFIVWMDSRSYTEAEELNAVFGKEQIHQETGQPGVIALSPGAKILWIRRNEPDIFAQTEKFVLLEDWFFYRMTGRFYGEGSLWCTSHMWNIHTNTWWEPVLEYLGISREQLPTLTETGTPLVALRSKIAEELGLSRNTLLVMGALDQACGAIGAGNVRPGVFSESTGSALVALTMTDHIVIDPEGVLQCFCSAIPGLYMIHSFSSGGIAYQWVRDALCEEERRNEKEGFRSAYTQMDSLAEEIPAGSDGLTVLAHFNGSGPPDNDPYVKCMIYGISMNHSRSHIIRAFMESIAVSISRMIDASQRLLGTDISEIRSLGGGAKSDLWCQIKADVNEKTVLTVKNSQDAACLGAAVIAGYGAGIFKSIQEASERFAQTGNIYRPDVRNREAYTKLKERYALLTDVLKPVTKEL